MIAAIEIVLVAIFGFFLFYLAMLSALALVAPKRSTMRSTRYWKMAVIVPAHNEESGIERTVRSVLAVDFPRESFDVIVIADNCTDHTAEIARRSGAIVFERKNPNLRAKGYALSWGFSRLLLEPAKYEAIVVVDADSVVSSNFLSVMNLYLERGAKAVQCSDMVEPAASSWSSEVTRIGFTLYNYTRPLGRRVIGCSAGLRGNGMCFAASTLRSIPWEAYSLAEDLEYGLELLLHGVAVAFAPEATVYSPMPQSAGFAEGQRARWEVGRLPLIRKFAGKLLRATFTQFSFRPFDALVDLVTPPLINLFIAIMLLLSFSLLLGALGISEANPFGWIWLILIGLAVFHVIVGLIAARADRLTYRAFFYIPWYALWKVFLYAKLLQHRQSAVWVRTPRDSSLVQPAKGKAKRRRVGFHE